MATILTEPTAPGRADERDLTKYFKALSDETRRRILYLLRDQERSVGEIVSFFHLSQPTISRHLAVLKEADLVLDRRRGQNVFYRLRGDRLAEVAVAFLGEFGGEVAAAAEMAAPTREAQPVVSLVR